MKINRILFVLTFCLLISSLSIVNGEMLSNDDFSFDTVNSYSSSELAINSYSTSDLICENSQIDVVNSSFISKERSASNVYVNYSGGNDDNNGQSWSNPVKTIEKALTIVESNGNINIANGITYRNTSNMISLNKNVNIIGQSQDNTIIDGQGTNGVFSVDYGINVKFINLTIQNSSVYDIISEGIGAILMKVIET